jgi:hypothetical protein
MGAIPPVSQNTSETERRSRLVAILAIGIALTAVALELAYLVGVFVMGVVRQIP